MFGAFELTGLTGLGKLVGQYCSNDPYGFSCQFVGYVMFVKGFLLIRI